MKSTKIKFSLYRKDDIPLLKGVSADIMKLYLRLSMDRYIKIRDLEKAWNRAYDLWLKKVVEDGWIIKKETDGKSVEMYGPDTFLHSDVE
ncbi:MAG: hypothetical protein L6M37_06425 [Candidatus Methylarchaceae archaeon HK02M1]|nr:hypothetical protein [Candidatus Methylarchaceae archaeon HK02M1]